MVNAVLSALIDRAAQSGVEVEAAVNIPAETAIDSADICAAVANTLENALNACLLAREEDRKISIRADYGGQDSGLEVERPVTDEELEARLQRFEDECKARFVEYLGQKYSGYVWMDIQGKVERDGEDLLILSMSCTVNLGNSLNVVRYFVADRQQEKILALSDLFGEEGDFISALDAEILRQIGLRTSDWEGEDYQEFYGWRFRRSG